MNSPTRGEHMLYTYTVRDQIHRCNNRYRAGAPRALDRLSTAVVDDLWITPRYFWNRGALYLFINTERIFPLDTHSHTQTPPCASADRQRGNGFSVRCACGRLCNTYEYTANWPCFPRGRCGFRCLRPLERQSSRGRSRTTGSADEPRPHQITSDIPDLLCPQSRLTANL